jgi:hypothetical protein
MTLDLLVMVIWVAIVYVLVRPRSKGAEMVTAVSSALAAVTRNAVDLAAAGG